MELRHLRYFVAVAEELHFGRAAERMCISQPPLSQQIQQLEHELGFALFHRTQRRVALTDAGQMFLEETRQVFATLDKAIRMSRRVARGEVGTLTIGFVGTATYAALPAILSAFRDRLPEVDLALRELVSARQVLALREGRIHVGLARPAVEAEDLISEVLSSEPLVAALPASHPLAAVDKLSLPTLASEPFILFPPNPKPSYADFLLSVCEQAGFHPQVIQETTEIHTAISLVSAGLGVTLVPASVQNVNRPGVVYRAFHEPIPMTELTAVYRRQDPSPVLQAFLRVARETLTSPPLLEGEGVGGEVRRTKK